MIFAAGASAICWALRLLTWDGAVAAALVGGIIWEIGGWSWVTPLLIFFITSSALSHIGKNRKEEAGLYVGQRRGTQVLANGGPAAVCALLYWQTGNYRLPAVMVATFACANADTWATEIGTLLGKRFFRISNLSETKRGISGAISTHGLVAAFLGAAVVAASAPLIGRTDLVGPLSVIGFAGSLVDSLLGDLFQAKHEMKGGKGWMSNDMVNFLSICSTAVAAYWLVALASA